MAQISEKETIPKYSIKTQKVTQTLILVSQLETSAPKKILVESIMQTYVSLFSGVTGASVTIERHIPRLKKGI